MNIDKNNNEIEPDKICKDKLSKINLSWEYIEDPLRKYWHCFTENVDDGKIDEDSLTEVMKMLYCYN